MSSSKIWPRATMTISTLQWPCLCPPRLFVHSRRMAVSLAAGQFIQSNGSFHIFSLPSRSCGLLTDPCHCAQTMTSPFQSSQISCTFAPSCISVSKSWQLSKLVSAPWIFPNPLVPKKAGTPAKHTPYFFFCKLLWAPLCKNVLLRFPAKGRFCCSPARINLRIPSTIPALAPLLPGSIPAGISPFWCRHPGGHKCQRCPQEGSPAPFPRDRHTGHHPQGEKANFQKGHIFPIHLAAICVGTFQ